MWAIDNGKSRSFNIQVIFTDRRRHIIVKPTERDQQWLWANKSWSGTMMMIWLLLFQCISGRPVCVSAPEEDTVHARAASMNVFQSELQWKTLYTVETATSYWFWKKSCFFRISLGVTLVSAVRRVSWHLRPSLLFCPRVSLAWGCHPITASPHCGGQRSASPVGFWPVEKPWSSTETVEDTLLRPPWTVHRPGTHTHMHTHAHTHTHTFSCFMGTLHRRNGVSTVQTVFLIPSPEPYR